MGILSRSPTYGRRSEDNGMKLLATALFSVTFGILLGLSFPSLWIPKVSLPQNLLRSIAISSRHSDIAAPVQATDISKIWVPSNPKGAERLPPGIIASESDLYLRRYLHMVKKHGLEISQPGLDPEILCTWQITKKREHVEVHKEETNEKPERCLDPHQPPCAAFVEIMAPVFSRDAWRCVWHMIQNDLVHGWGLDFALRRCVEEPAYEKIGIVDTEWIVHQSIPSLGSQGKEEDGISPGQGVRDRCYMEWVMFEKRVDEAEKEYFKSLKVQTPSNSTTLH
ncbi:hypothetical protein YC2023_059068 [Brassica napus]